MHDGQNLFNPGDFNHGTVWGVDLVLEALMSAGESAGALVVAIWNTALRLREYMPSAPFEFMRDTPIWEHMLAQSDGPPLADAYLDFLTAELKPFIDTTFATQPGRETTFIMGSSMGGLVSLYALTRHPELFGAAGCLSTHWTIGGNGVVDALAAALPPPGHHRLYFDHGTEGLDADYEPLQRRMDEYMRRAGYREGYDWQSLTFAGADHNEAAWHARLHLPLRFLLRKVQDRPFAPDSLLPLPV
jgi:predicted alpha/beta superfamily hydrolase